MHPAPWSTCSQIEGCTVTPAHPLHPKAYTLNPPVFVLALRAVPQVPAAVLNPLPLTINPAPFEFDTVRTYTVKLWFVAHVVKLRGVPQVPVADDVFSSSV